MLHHLLSKGHLPEWALTLCAGRYGTWGLPETFLLIFLPCISMTADFNDKVCFICTSSFSVSVRVSQVKFTPRKCHSIFLSVQRNFCWLDCEKDGNLKELVLQNELKVSCSLCPLGVGLMSYHYSKVQANGLVGEKRPGLTSNLLPMLSVQDCLLYFRR